MDGLDLRKNGNWNNGAWNAVNWTPEMCAKLIELRELRIGADTIGDRLGGIDGRTVRNQMAKMGLPARLPALQPETHEQAREMHAPRPPRTDAWARLQSSFTFHRPIAPARTCQFPQWGDEKPKHYTFCGASVWKGSYCYQHWRDAHVQRWEAA